MAALASSIGASNIVGVPIAIVFGGPGAVFWMWMLAIVGGATKYAEIALGIQYRERNEKGEYICIITYANKQKQGAAQGAPCFVGLFV